MKYGFLAAIFFLTAFTSDLSAQSNAQKIYDTEKSFEKAVAEKGFNRGFIEFTTPDAICYFPGYRVNCREYFTSQPESKATLIWNPTLIDASSNGAMAYSVGNSVYRAAGKDDPTAYYGHYLTVWIRQPDGNYRVVLDTGITHDKPVAGETNWQTPADSGKELNEKKISAADVSTEFFETASKQGRDKAYKKFLAEDAVVMRSGLLPIVGKKAAESFLKKDKSTIVYAKRSTFSSAADMAYTASGYTLTDKNGKQIEKGDFVQIWKFRNGKWQIVLDYASAGKQ